MTQLRSRVAAKLAREEAAKPKPAPAPKPAAPKKKAPAKKAAE